MITTNIEKITPDIANYYLTKNISNRSISKRTIQQYVEDIKIDNWTLNHQGIAFYEDGTLADGQHRLMAIVKAGKTIEMMVFRGLVNGKDIDQHKRRSIPDAISIGRLSDVVDKNVAAMFNLLSENSVKTSILSVANFANKYREEIIFIRSISFPKTRSLSSITIKSSVFRAVVWKEDRDLLRRFVEVFSSGKMINEYEVAAIVLRNHMLSQRSFRNRTDIIMLDKKCQYAIQCFLSKKPIKQIYTPKSNIYEIYL